MNTVIRIREGERIRPYQVAITALVGLVVAAGSLLLSAPESSTLVDGARPWSEGSPLRAVVALLCLDYQWPTFYAGEIKVFVLNLGAAAALAVVALTILLRSQRAEADSDTDTDLVAATLPPAEPATQATPDTAPAAPGESPAPPAAETPAAPAPAAVAPVAPAKPHSAPWWTAQALACLYLLWSVASRGWSAAPDLAVGGSVLLILQFAWAWSLGNTLNRRTATRAWWLVLTVAALVGAIALWYVVGRNPELRAKFPFGNPLFLAACLLPALVGAGTWIVGTLRQPTLPRAREAAGPALLCGLVILLAGWAFLLADSRAAYAGVVMAALTAWFLAARAASKWLPALLAVAAIAAGGWLLSQQLSTASPTGRDATARVRMYAWSYAWRMFTQAPFKGHGQGGFVLQGDSYSVDDVERDWPALSARLAHAHNEWLEVLADLGLVGLVLIVGTLWCTLQAGWLALRQNPPPAQRWALIGLLASLVGLAVEECFGVGLRVSGVPVMWFTVLGLAWAMSRPGEETIVEWVMPRPARRWVVGGATGIAALGGLLVAQTDFAAARATYDVQNALLDEDYTRALQLAENARYQLNPQRALTNLAKLSEAHLRSARQLQARGLQREQRAAQTEMPDPRLLQLARADYDASNEHCQAGLAVLKELVSRSPGFYNQGQLECLLLLTQANNPPARLDADQRNALVEGALAAIKRELLRQPFDMNITLQYLRLANNPLAPPKEQLDLPSTLELLARPLRHESISTPCVEFLLELAGSPEAEGMLGEIVARAQQAAPHIVPFGADPPAELAEPIDWWAPEKLRLVATLWFWQGRYEEAAELLEVATAAYDHLQASAPYGAAVVRLELADSLFKSNPQNPQPALEAARTALERAPVSEQGRNLQQACRVMLTTYLLALGDEDDARQQLLALAPGPVAEAQLQQELGVRYARLCSSVLNRRRGGLRVSPNDLPEGFKTWLGRALELAPDHPLGHQLAADLAVWEGDCPQAAIQLQAAIQTGMPLEDAFTFLQAATVKLPDCEGLQQLLSAFGPPADEQPQPEQQDAPPPTAEAEAPDPATTPAGQGEPPAPPSPGPAEPTSAPQPAAPPPAP